MQSFIYLLPRLLACSACSCFSSSYVYFSVTTYSYSTAYTSSYIYSSVSFLCSSSASSFVSSSSVSSCYVGPSVSFFQMHNRINLATVNLRKLKLLLLHPEICFALIWQKGETARSRLPKLGSISGILLFRRMWVNRVFKITDVEHHSTELRKACLHKRHGIRFIEV